MTEFTECLLTENFTNSTDRHQKIIMFDTFIFIDCNVLGFQWHWTWGQWNCSQLNSHCPRLYLSTVVIVLGSKKHTDLFDIIQTQSFYTLNRSTKRRLIRVRVRVWVSPLCHSHYWTPSLRLPRTPRVRVRVRVRARVSVRVSVRVRVRVRAASANP